jgi:hypothetical protein
MIMDWLFLIFLVPLILVPIVLLCGFAGCGLDVVGTGVFDAAPSNLNATAGGTDTINLSWKDNSVAASVFIVERGPPGGSLVPIKTGVKGVTSVDNPPSEGTTYLYDVRATAGVGGVPTAPSNIVMVTTFPATPTNLAATAVDASHVQLSWTNASVNADLISLEHRSSPGSLWNEIYKGPAKTPPKPPPASITPGGNDEFRITAIVKNGFDNNISKEVRSIPSAPISGITEIPITPWKPAYNIPITIDGNNPGVVGGWQGHCMVQVINFGRLTNSGSKVRITLRGPTTKNLIIDKVSISQGVGTPPPPNSAADLVEVRFGGVSGVTIPAGTPMTLDDTNYALDRTKNLLIAFDINAAAGNDSIGRAAVPQSTMYSRPATKEALTKAPQSRSPGYVVKLPDSVYLVEKIEVQ